MAREGASTSPRALLLDAQLIAAEDARKREASRPAGNGYDSDEH